jgi:hypothetical protein
LFTHSTFTSVMILLDLILLLRPIANGSPATRRQSTNETTSPVDGTAPKVTIGGPDHPVEITGSISVGTNLDQYFNIPFAKARKSAQSPPTNLTDSLAVGELRFAPPQPATHGTTINATSYGPACLQTSPTYASVYGDLVGAYGQSEDCLQLNVFVPRDVVYIATGLPVVVFVPGGGFFGGSANSVDGSVWLATATSIVSHPWGDILIPESTLRLRFRPI